MIKDSGNRTEFDTGAVRDMQEGKGEFTVMPLSQVAELMQDPIINLLDIYIDEHNTGALKIILSQFAKIYYSSLEEMILEVAIHYESGMKKYGRCNWQKGIPEESYINSAMRHYLKHRKGDTDERHDRAFVWNILCLWWTNENFGEGGRK